MREYINHFNQTNYSKNYIHRLMKLIHIHARIRRKKSNYVKVKSEQVGENIKQKFQSRLSKSKMVYRCHRVQGSRTKTETLFISYYRFI